MAICPPQHAETSSAPDVNGQGLAHGAAVREPTPRFPAPPSRLCDARTRGPASHTAAAALHHADKAPAHRRHGRAQANDAHACRRSLNIHALPVCGNARSCRDAVRPGARALICQLPAGAPALLSEHCERLWLLPRAETEMLAEVGLEVPVLCEPQGGAMPEQAGSLRRHRGSRYRVNPGPKARRLGLRAL